MTTDFTFAWEGATGAGPWEHLSVVELEGREEISSPFRYDVTLLSRAPAPEVSPRDLVHARATLRIATLTRPAFRVVHGVITEAEELASVPEGMLYRIVLSPPVARAQYRKRCRIFLEKTLRQIVDAVLQGDPNLSLADGAHVEEDDGSLDFALADEVYAWRIADPSRIDDGRVRPYVVQYNESDLAFVSRLLEEEGIAYHYEHGKGICLLVLSDSDGGKARLEPFDPLAIDIDGREVTTMKLGARMRAKAVWLDDYNWKRPAVDMLAEAGSRESQDGLFEYQYPGGFPDEPRQGIPLAAAMLDRYRIEADYATGEGRTRLLSAGAVFALRHAKSRYEGEYLVTQVRLRGEQQGVVSVEAERKSVPFSARFECARRGDEQRATESRYRPARRTPKPRIVGSQTAFVTADPGAPGEIHVGGPAGAEIGCVRLRFHWDKDDARLAKEPSSCWVRVSQVFAGVGQGGVFHPRVGVEAIVEFEDGDPDRPIVTGRVYNGQNQPPGGAATVSTMKSFSSPGGGTYNEMLMDDTAGNERFHFNAGKDMDLNVGNDRSEAVASNSSSSVGGSRSEATGGSRSAEVGGNESASVGGNQSNTVGGNQSMLVGGNQSTTVGGSQANMIAANQVNVVGALQSTSVGADQGVEVGGSQSVDVAGAQQVKVGGSQGVQIGGAQTTVVAGPQSLASGASQSMVAPSQAFQAEGNQTFAAAVHQVAAGTFVVQAGDATLQAPTVTINGDGSIGISGGNIVITGGQVSVQGGTLALAGGPVSVNGSPVAVDGGGNISMSAGVVRIN